MKRKSYVEGRRPKKPGRKDPDGRLLCVWCDGPIKHKKRKVYCSSRCWHEAHFSGTDTEAGLLLAAQHGYDRLILITDEQSHTRYPDPKTELAYCVNVSVEKNGIGYGSWTHIDGFSEKIIDYILAREES